MARSFGKEKDEEDGVDPQEAGACGGDEGDSTQQVQPVQHPDAAAESQHIYLEFFRTEMERSGLQAEVECLDRSDEVNNEIINPPDPARILDWTRAGQELRHLADAFSRSKERQTVRKRAQTISLETLDATNFFQLMQELFQYGGITRERILVLFFFCADIAIEALKRGCHDTFHQLVSWSLRYIATNVARFVHSMGGWGVLLRNSLHIAINFSAVIAFTAVAVACAVYIRRNLQ